MRTSRKFVLLGAAVVVAGLAVGTGVAIADGGATVIHGCVNNDTKVLRVVSTGSGKAHCASGESALQWNQTGPQGPAGPAGPQGPAGPAAPDSISGSRIQLQFWDVPAATTIHPFVYCPANRPVATGGGVEISEQDQDSGDIQIEASYPMATFGGLADEADGWKAAVRNGTGRPFNGRTVEVTIYAICAPGTIEF